MYKSKKKESIGYNLAKFFSKRIKKDGEREIERNREKKERRRRRELF